MPYDIRCQVIKEKSIADVALQMYACDETLCQVLAYSIIDLSNNEWNWNHRIQMQLLCINDHVQQNVYFATWTFSSCKLNYIFRGIVLFQKKVSNSCKINVLLNATNIFFVCSYFSNLAHIIDVTCTCHY